MKISVVIIAKNEEQVIARCIAAVQFAQEIIIIDAESTDKTAAIASSLGATVISHPWPGYGEQKNFGASHATHDWILFLDADEIVSEELQSTLRNIPETSKYEVYWINVEDIFLGRRFRHLVGHNPRLVKKGAASWNNKKVHEQLLYSVNNTPARYKDSISGEITSPIIHESYKKISAYLRKMHTYTTLDAMDMQERGTHRSGRAIKKTHLLPYTLAFRQAVKLLIYRKGILDGWQGIVWSILSAYYEFEMGKKYLQLYPSPHPSPRLGRGR